MTPEVLRGHLHGFIIYRASHAKPHDRPWMTNEEIQDEHFRKHVPHGASHPLQFELPRQLPQLMMASPYDKPDPLLASQAASRLFSNSQWAFAAAADAAARNYADIHPDAQHHHFTHLHGIGSWESKLEPSMTTVFHRPITPSQLQKIAADVGSWARQEGILTFVPHSGGVEQMMHMRVPTHSPLIQKLSPGLVAGIAGRITGLFNQHFDVTPQGVKEYLMPGRSILPDTNGHTDVLVWVPPFVNAAGQGRMHDAFQQISHAVNGKIQYWRGTGKIIGGMHPYDNDPREFSDMEKRAIATVNYHKALSLPSETTKVHPGDVELPSYEPTEPQRFARYDIPGLHAGIASNPHDDARWGVAADAFDEESKPATAGLFRGISTSPRTYQNGRNVRGIMPPSKVSPSPGWYGQPAYIGDEIPVDPPPQPRQISPAQTYQGRVAGVPVSVEKQPHGWNATVHHPHSGNRLAYHPISEEHGNQLIGEFDPQELEHLQMERSPAKTGIVIRGVFYAPGKIIPDLITADSGRQPSKMSAEEFRAKFRIAYNARRSKKNADDSPARSGDHNGG